MGVGGDEMNAGDVEVDSIEVQADSGTHELVGLGFTVNLVEDIFSNTINGVVEIVDASGTFDKMQLVGKEKIKIKWKTPDPVGSGFAEFEGRIVKITNIKKLKESVIQYHLVFATDEYVKDPVSQFSKVYKGKVHEIVKKIAEDELEIDDVDVEDTDNEHEHKIIVPYWTPLYTINWLASRAKHKDKDACNFLFYQTLGDGAGNSPKYKFASLDTLFKDEKNNSQVGTKSKKFNVQPSNLTSKSDRDILLEMGNCAEYELIDGVDTLKHIIDGTFAGTLITHDIVTKKFKEQRDGEDKFKEFDYNEYFGNSTHLGKQKIDPDHEATGDLTQKDEGKTRLRLYPQHKGLFTSEDKDYYDEKKARARWADKWAIERQSGIIAQLGAVRFQVVVPGDSTRRAGDIVHFAVPAFAPEQEQGSNKKLDAKLEGKFLVSNVVHVFQRNNYKCIIELIKESYEK
jgi:DNA-directed RNA polymerase subunit H (RpoH/RPB5)